MKAFRHTAACITAAFLLLGAARAQQAAVEYTVAPRDTLIQLSRDLLVDPARWPDVAAFNRLPDPNRIRPGQVLRVPADLMRSAPLTARLVSSEGDVTVNGAPAAAGTPVTGQQSVVTGADSSAVVELADGSRVRVAPATEATLDEHRRFATRHTPDPAAAASAPAATPAGTGGPSDEGWFAGAMRLVKGSVEVFATKVQRAQPLEVRAPTAVVGVRGTEFRVHHEGSPGAATLAETLEGRVSAQPLAGGAAAVALERGFGAVIGAGGQASVRPLLPAPDLGAVPGRFERPLVRFAVPGEARTLRVQVAADPAFDRIVSEQNVAAGTDVRIAGLADGTWFLRARRVDEIGLQGLDAARQFVLKARPEPPATIAPPPGGKVSAGEVVFAWAENIEAASYVVEVARDAQFAAPLASLPVTGAGMRLRIDTPGHYHWRLASVRADGDRGPWNDTQAFEVRERPSAPQSEISGSQLRFHWSGRAEDRQQVQIARDAAFTDIVASAELQASEWTLANPGAGTYYFRYRSIEPDGFTSDWSSTLKLDVPRDWRYVWLLLLPLLGAL